MVTFSRTSISPPAILGNQKSDPKSTFRTIWARCEVQLLLQRHASHAQADTHTRAQDRSRRREETDPIARGLLASPNPKQKTTIDLLLALDGELNNRAQLAGASACAAWGAEVDARFLWPLGRWRCRR
ncbi:hypothetical protein [Bradyrhizobium sp. Rc2d]|uniref:hypothetical protein n=1 Tax=Bradyrhizobium sp. Rc2d TaxID=1855321 RepID=UPI00115FE23A|nr:hypothetical protein [Bradyrhizobium sp. Rc2d]